MASPRNDRFLVILMSATMFVNVANISSVNIALPAITRELRLDAAGQAWVVSAYMLTFAGFLLVSGRVADIVGRRRLLLNGLTLFGACAVVNALSAGPLVLIGSRLLQGIGAAGALPAAIGILSSAFPDEPRRGRALAAFGAAGASGFAVGLVVGGLITEPLGWRWVFFASAVPAVVVLALARLKVPAQPPHPEAASRVDWWGALTATAGLCAIVFSLINAGRQGWAAASTIAGTVCGLGLLAAFAAIQTKVADPLLPGRLRHQPGLGSALAIGFCVFAAWVGANMYASLALQRVLGYSAPRASFALLPMALGGMVLSTLAGRILVHTGVRALLLSGMAAYFVAFVLLANLRPDTRYWTYLLPAVLLGVLGNAFGFVSANVWAMSAAAPADQSLVGGLFTAANQIGGVVGLAAMTSLAGGITGTRAGEAAELAGYRAAFWVAAGLSVVAAVVALAARARSLHHVGRAQPAPERGTDSRHAL